MSGELHVDTIIPETELTVTKKLCVDTDLTVKGSVTLEGLNSAAAEEITGNEKVMIQKEDMTVAGLSLDALMPAGTIIPFGGVNVPDGWLLCDGTEYARTVYPRLYNAIETVWGGNAAVFNVPDLRGQFLRGTDYLKVGETSEDYTDPGAETGAEEADKRTDSTGTEVGSVVGSRQKDAFQDHSISMGGHGGANDLTDSPAFFGNLSGHSDNDKYTTGQTNFLEKNTNGIPRISLETRPKNTAVNYIIKY